MKMLSKATLVFTGAIMFAAGACFTLPARAQDAAPPAGDALGTYAPGTAGPLHKLPSAYSAQELQDLGEGIVFPYDLLDAVLGKCVDINKGYVNYLLIKGDPNLDLFVHCVAVADTTDFPAFPRPADPNVPNSKPGVDRTAELTFWINAYNGLFLKVVSDAYPVSSIKSIAGLDTDRTRIVGGKAYSFAQLRDIIAAIDPRGLFALPNGTLDGPMELDHAFRYAHLNFDLDDEVLAYINNNKHVSAPDRDNNVVQVSPWLAAVDADFKPSNSHKRWDGIRVLLGKYTDAGNDHHNDFGGDRAARDYFLTNEYDVSFLPANTAMNDSASNQ